MKKIITNKYVLNAKNDYSNNECLNIIYGSDENYQLGAGVSSVSLLINNPHLSFRFHFFHNIINTDFIEKLKWIADKFSTEIIVYELNNEYLKDLPASDIWSSAMYFRLVALDYLASDYDYALYLDADIICCGNLNLSTSLISKLVCGVVADDTSVIEKSETRLNIPELSKTYFNSGVMFINLKEWKKHKITHRCFELLSQPNAKQLYKYPDQDVLNIILKEHQFQLDKCFNTIYTLKNELRDKSHNKYKHIITENTVLIHYTGVTKPWHVWARYPSAKPFTIALEQSPWTECDLKPATKFIEKKKEYKHLFKQGKFISGCLSGIKYLYMKNFNKKR